MDKRENALRNWLKQLLPSEEFSLNPLAGDASFRRYFRMSQPDVTRIIMDAPPDKETVQPFLQVAHLLNKIGITIPQIHAYDQMQGFVMLDDLGDTLLLQSLDTRNADMLYSYALKMLIQMQTSSPNDIERLPVFDKKYILQELSLFHHWFLQIYLNIQLSPQEEQLIADTFEQLATAIIKQPQTFMHRDYHSRNIMLITDKPTPVLGLIDFQDAMQGPVSYDLVSLLKDCYIQWPPERINRWITSFYEQAPQAQQVSLEQFKCDFDFCGLQRHLKVLGIFSRLYLRDEKANYLQNLPLTLHYVMACLECYDSFKPFYQFMQEKVQLP